MCASVRLWRMHTVIAVRQCMHVHSKVVCSWMSCMLTVIAVGQIMRVLVCVFLCTRHMLTAIPVRHVVCSLHAHWNCCEAMLACV